MVKIDPLEREMPVKSGQRDFVYVFGEMDKVPQTYAIPIHESQGAEFPVVVIPLATQHHLVLQRNSVYTCVTRGKRLAVLVGKRKAMAMTVQERRFGQRL